MNDTKTSIIILIAAAIVYVVWVVGRDKAAQRREEREWQAKQAQLKTKGKGNKRR